MRCTTSTLATLAAVLSLVNPIFAMGKNCEGGDTCHIGIGDIANRLTDNISHIPPDRYYLNLEPITCVPLRPRCDVAVCAFLRYMNDDAYGREIIARAHFISEHCKICGGVPYHSPSHGNIFKGELTYDVYETGRSKVAMKEIPTI